MSTGIAPNQERTFASVALTNHLPGFAPGTHATPRALRPAFVILSLSAGVEFLHLQVQPRCLLPSILSAIPKENRTRIPVWEVAVIYFLDLPAAKEQSGKPY